MKLLPLMFAGCLLFSWTPLSADDTRSLTEIRPLVRVVDLDVGEQADVELCDGSRVTIKLVSLKEHRDPIRQAVRESDLVVEINGQAYDLNAGAYRLPQTLGPVRIDCTATRGLNSNGTPSFWGLDKDARLRLWPQDSPLLQPGSMIYPARQQWLATRTWFDNEAVDGGPSVRKSIYYHAGMDIGGSEGLVEVIAATDALVVQRGTTVLEGHQEDTPTAPRYDVVYLLDGRGWYYRYSHLKEIDPAIQPGAILRQGTRIGLVGKEGASGGWTHLHFEIKSRQPSGKWGTQAAFGFLQEAYRAEFGLSLYANARPASFLVAGQETILDGSRSWSADNSITSYEWTLHDGTTASGPLLPVTYKTPGLYSEILKVTDATGHVDYDFANVMVLDPANLQQYTCSINANHHPSRNVQPGTEITFKVRSNRMQGGREAWDFGDGSPLQYTESPGNSHPHDPQGYAAITHSYSEPGQYIVTVSRTHNNGQTATTRLLVKVQPQ